MNLIRIFIVRLAFSQLKSPLNAIVLFLFLPSICFGYSKQEIRIYLALNECVNCYSAINQIAKQKGIQKTLVVQKSDSAIIAEFSEEYFPGVFDSIEYTKKPVLGSYCLLMHNKNVVDSFGLRDLHRHLKDIDNSGSSKKFLHFPIDTKLNFERIESAMNSSFISFYDYILNKVIVFELQSSGDSLQKVWEVKGSEFNNEVLRKLAKFDSSFYYEAFPEMKSMGKGKAHIESIFQKDSVLFLLISLPTPLKISKNDWGVFTTLFLYERNLVTGNRNIMYINGSEFYDKFNFKYFIDNSKSFSVNSDNCVFYINDESKNSDSIIFLSKWHIKKNRIEFNSFPFDKVAKSEKLRTDSSQFFISHEVAYSANGKYCRRLDTNTDLILQQINSKDFILDLRKSEAGFNVLFSNVGKIRVARYDSIGNLLSASDINDIDDCNQYTGKFIDENKLIFIGRDKKKMVLIPVVR